MSDMIHCLQHSANARIYMNIRHGSTYQWSNTHVNNYLSYSTNVWYHMVVVMNEVDGNVKFYKNGVLDSIYTTTQFPNLITRDNNYIGAHRGSTMRYLDGKIKSLNIWERALSATEISDLYNLGRNYTVISLNTNLKHAIYFDPSISNYDLTGNSTVTLHNNPTVDVDGLNLVKRARNMLH